MIKYSLILTTLNEEKRVVNAMDQFEKFKRNDFEVILIDSDSSDSTLELVKQKHYSFPLLIKVDKSDLNTARNLGISLANGEIVSIATVDNLLPENYLDRLDRYYNEGYDAVLCLYELPVNTNTWSSSWAYAQRRLLYDGKENTGEFLWTEGFSCRKDIAKRIKFPYINKNASGAEVWFGKQLKDIAAKIAYATDVDVKHIAPASFSEFFQERKKRTRGAVFIEYYLYSFSKLGIMLRALVRILVNLIMIVLLFPSILEAFKLYPKAKEKSLKRLWWFFIAGQIDLFARVVGKLEAINTLLTVSR